jgi:hypothetical protein
VSALAPLFLDIPSTAALIRESPISRSRPWEIDSKNLFFRLEARIFPNRSEPAAHPKF